MPVIDRAIQKAALMKKFTNPDVPAFPGAVAMTCSECGTHILWVNPPLPPSGRTICKECE